MPNMDSCSNVVEEVFVEFEVPRIPYSDQSRQYGSQLFQKLCAFPYIEKSIPSLPHSNGMVERLNKSMVSMLSVYVNKQQINRDESFINHAGLSVSLVFQ